MRIVALAAALVLFSSCTSDAPQEETAPMETMEATPADFAGTWNSTVTLDGVDDPIQSELVGSPDGSVWMMHLPDRDSIHLDVSVEDDSLIAVSERYESILRAGQMVVVRTASVVQGNEMNGKVRVTYFTDDGEEVVHGTIRSTRTE